MATITIQIDLRSKQAKRFFDYMKSLPFVKVKENKSAIDQSLQEVKEGKINTYTSVDDFFNKVVN